MKMQQGLKKVVKVEKFVRVFSSLSVVAVFRVEQVYVVGISFFSVYEIR